MLANAAAQLAPDSVVITPWSGLDQMPHCVGEGTEPDPPLVADLKTAISAHDALLVVTPEHNFGVPSVLKNAIDWASTPPGRSVLRGKTAAIMGASPGMLGTARAQMQLRQMFVFTQTYAVLQPEILVSHAAQKFEDGRLVDPLTAKLIARLWDSLVDLTRRLR
jgi:chromate reductase